MQGDQMARQSFATDLTFQLRPVGALCWDTSFNPWEVPGMSAFTRRYFIRLGASATAMRMAPKVHGLDAAVAEAMPNLEDAAVVRNHGADSEMAMANAWAQSFRLPSSPSTPSASKLLPDTLKPPFAFVYGDRSSADFLPGWRCEVKNSTEDDTKVQQEAIYTGPQSGLVVRCEVTRFKNFPAVEWVINFKN